MVKQGRAITRKDRDQATRRLIGDRIRKHRNAQDLTQEALAEKIGRNLSVNSLSRYETGETEMGIVTYLAIAAALGTTLNDLAPSDLIKNLGPSPILRDYEELTDDRKYIVDQVISSLFYQQKNEK